MPTIPIEESDYAAGSGALSAERVFKNADPATSIREQTENTIWHGLRQGIIVPEQISGDLTAANYAADLAAGFPLLGKGIRRAARRLRAAEVVTLVLDSPGFTFTPAPDAYAFLITEDGGGPYDGGAVYPSTVVPTTNDRRRILVINTSTTKKVVGDSASQDAITLQPGDSCEFYGLPVSGPATKWIPIGHPIDDNAFGNKTLLVRSYRDGGADMSSSVSMTYTTHGPGNCLMTINIPETSVTMTDTAGGIEIAPASSYIDFSDLFMPLGGNAASPESPVIVIPGLVDAARVLFLGSFINGKLTFFLQAGGTIASASVVQLAAISFTYHRYIP